MSRSTRRHARGHGLVIRRKTTPGAPPGTFVIDPEAPAPKIHVIAYGSDRLDEADIDRPEDIRGFLGKWPVVWINVDGLGDADVLQRVAEVIGIHRLALEDIVNVHQRPKAEDYGENLFVVSRMVHNNDQITTEQVSLFLGAGFLVTFQEREGDCLDPVRQRIRSRRGRIATAGADYLGYAILDAIIDDHFPVFEVFGEALHALEEETIERPRQETLRRLHRIKRELLVLRRAVWPQRDMLNRLLKEESPLVGSETKIYLRDSYDHTVQLIDMLENYRELAASLMELYLTMLNNRMNEVMKVLTIIATIFIPLSFITGLYGMNFDTSHPLNMPELSLPFGYPLALGLMGLVAGLLLLFFRRRHWIGR
jgi:magnesium transporter